MTPERFRAVEALFELTVDLPAEDRAAVLERTCSDKELRQAAEKLLAANDHEQDYLENVVGRAGEQALGAAEIGMEFSGWRLERRIGQGGMGTVYLARREKEGFAQMAALKILRAGGHFPELVGRFRHERKILASLVHRNIAGLLDGGTTASGLPWFAMEYVEGEPLDVYCERAKLSVRARLSLFREVCLAVHFAHRNLIIHRDLKPSNLLVTAEGIPKLLDFGIAKLLDGRESSDTELRLLTPEYASPEQLHGEPITTAADIYSLGVILYNLLTGRMPYRSGAGDPEPPAMGPDLDAILRKALARAPEARYASAEALAEDIRSYLGGYPVAARPATWSYAAIKYLERHTASSFAAMAGLLLLIAFAGIAYRGWSLVNRERQTAEAALTFLSSVFSAPDPNLSLGAETTAKQLLDAGSRRIGDERQPEVRARLQEVMASAYRGLGRFDDAEALLRKALPAKEQQYGRQSAQVAQTLAQLGGALFENGKSADALPIQEEALRIREHVFGSDSPESADSLYDLALLHDDTGRYTAAETAIRRALEIHRKHSGPRSEVVSSDLMVLAGILRHTGRIAAAEPLYRQALEIRQKLHGPDSPDVAHSLNHLGRCLIQMGRPAEALPYIEESFRIRSKVFGISHPETAASRSNLAGAYSSLEQYSKALPLYEETLRQLKAGYGERHPYVAATYFSVGRVLLMMGNLSAAAPAITRSLQLHRKLLEPGHPDLLRAATLHGMLLHRRGELAAAEAELRQIESLGRKTFNEQHPDLAETRAALAACLMDMRKFDEAEKLLLTAWEALRKSRGETYPSAQRVAARLVSLYDSTGRSRQAGVWRPRVGSGQSIQ